MKLGQWAEQQALTVLEEQGYVHVRSNYHSRFGEIDLIVQKGQELVFVEVKARSKTRLRRLLKQFPIQNNAK